MIKGFEKETAPLNEQELKYAEALAQHLRRDCEGHDNAITAKSIASHLNMPKSSDVGARVRKIVSYLRITGEVPLLLASNKGYYIARDRTEAVDYIQSLLHRSAAITTIANALADQLGDVKTEELELELPA